MRMNLCFLATLIPTVVHAQTDWTVIDSRWRPDANPFAEKQIWEGTRWIEGWPAPEQFYPDHFRPAGSLHVILRNDTGRATTLELTHVNGAETASVTTTPQVAGPVVWYWVEPESVAPGDWTACAVRLRSVPTRDVTLSFRTDGGGTAEVAVPLRPRPFRIESISFSPTIDRLYVYIRSLDGRRVPRGKLRLDGKKAGRGVRWTGGPGRGDLALVEALLDPAWQPGSRHLVEIRLPKGKTLAQPVRAWDNYFEIGLYGVTDDDSVKDAAAHGFNTYVVSGPQEILDRHGLNYVVSHGIGEGRLRTRDESGTLYYANHDEPDAHDYKLGEDLPLRDRLGVHAQERVIPFIRYQREKDPRTLNMVLVDNTFKPLNWYMYGQLPDILCTDPYVPLSGEQLDRVPFSLDAARDACTPRPLIAVLWACRLARATHHYAERAPFPEEERMMAYYALGCGIKGISYFIDMTSSTGEGAFTGASDIPELWDEIGRVNREIAVLAPSLSVGCPLPGGFENQQVWSRRLWCGRDRLVLIVVNKDHHIAYNTKSTYAFHAPARDVVISVELPRHFRRARVRELKAGGLHWFPASFRDGSLRLSLPSVDTARAFMISAAGKD